MGSGSVKSSVGNSLTQALHRLKSNLLTLLAIMFEPNPDVSRVCTREDLTARKKAKVRTFVK